MTLKMFSYEECAELRDESHSVSYNNERMEQATKELDHALKYDFHNKRKLIFYINRLIGKNSAIRCAINGVDFHLNILKRQAEKEIMEVKNTTSEEK